MEKRIVFLVLGIISAVVLVFALYKLTGFASLSDKGICIDSDKGFNKYERGTIKYANRSYSFTDFCVRSAKLREYYCGPGNISLVYKKVNCENGCKDGACMK